MPPEILYQPDSTVKLEVRLENETVWLNRNQIALLFDRDIKTIGKHIANALKDLTVFQLSQNLRQFKLKSRNTAKPMTASS